MWYRSIRRNGRRYQHVLTLCAALTGVILKGLTVRIFLFDVLFSVWVRIGFSGLTYRVLECAFGYDRV